MFTAVSCSKTLLQNINFTNLSRIIGTLSSKSFPSSYLFSPPAIHGQSPSSSTFRTPTPSSLQQSTRHSTISAREYTRCCLRVLTVFKLCQFSVSACGSVYKGMDLVMKERASVRTDYWILGSTRPCILHRNHVKKFYTGWRVRYRYLLWVLRFESFIVGCVL